MNMDLDSITAANQRNSPLLRLPAELRNKIYCYAFESNEVCLTARGFYHRYFRTLRIHPMSLAQSCTQCRYEALPYFWSSTTFNLGFLGVDGFAWHVPHDLRHQIKVINVPVGLFQDLVRRESIVERPCARLETVILPSYMVHLYSRDYIEEKLKVSLGKDLEIIYVD
ncbi:asparagine synthetase [Alternaria alternata]|nr:asparagine synthetase [Alternaria alternata]